MKILVSIESSNFLLCHEALSLAFALAAFDHQIQLYIGSAMLELLQDEPTGKIANMLASLEMYDMPPAWISESAVESVNNWQTCHPESDYAWHSQLSCQPTNHADFDTTFIL